MRKKEKKNRVNLITLTKHGVNISVSFLLFQEKVNIKSDYSFDW